MSRLIDAIRGFLRRLFGGGPTEDVETAEEGPAYTATRADDSVREAAPPEPTLRSEEELDELQSQIGHRRRASGPPPQPPPGSTEARADEGSGAPPIEATDPPRQS